MYGHGVPKNTAKGLQMVQEYQSAILDLAEYYELGLHGIAKDLKKALQYYKKVDLFNESEHCGREVRLQLHNRQVQETIARIKIVNKKLAPKLRVTNFFLKF